MLVMLYINVNSKLSAIYIMITTNKTKKTLENVKKTFLFSRLIFSKYQIDFLVDNLTSVLFDFFYLKL